MLNSIVYSFGIDTLRSQQQSSDNSIGTSTLFAETIENTKTLYLYCFLTKCLPNVKRVSCVDTKKGVVGNKFNLIDLSSITSGISNMGEAINVLSFYDNFPFQI